MHYAKVSLTERERAQYIQSVRMSNKLLPDIKILTRMTNMSLDNRNNNNN